MTLEKTIESFQQLESSAKRAGRAIILYSALALSAVSCGRQQSECCQSLKCYNKSASGSWYEMDCTDSSTSIVVDHCVTDKKGTETCCICIDQYNK